MDEKDYKIPLNEEKTNRDIKNPTSTQCGCGSWRPKFLRRFSGIKTFAILLSFMTLLNHMQMFYYNGIVTSIEKIFGYSSSVTGLLKNVNHISYIFSAILVAHFCRYSNKPRILAATCLLSSLASAVFVLPHIIYGKGLMEESVSQEVVSIANESALSDGAYLCSPDALNTFNKSTQNPISEASSDGSSNTLLGALALMCIAQILRGIAQSPVIALGMTHIEDSSKKNSPLLLGVVFLLSSFGLIFGMLLSGLANSLYVDLSETSLDTSDPSWISAWWIGYLIAAIAYIIIAFPLLMLPASVKKADTIGPEIIKTNKKTKKTELEELRQFQNQGLSVIASAKDLPAAFYRMFTNPLFVFILLAMTSEFYKMGFLTFQPKYFELYFHLDPVKSSMASGATAAIPFLVGPVLGGFIMSRLQPSLKKLYRILLIGSLLALATNIIMLAVQCPQTDWAQGLDSDLSQLDCSEHCSCDAAVFNPVCGDDGQQYWSACTAGCTTSHSDETINDCSCIISPLTGSNETSSSTPIHGSASVGYCDGPCNGMFALYMGTFLLGSLIVGCCLIPMFVNMMRICDDRDKALVTATGSTLVMGLVIPAPLIYGMVIDSTCVAYRTLLGGGLGTCAVYELDDLRFGYHGLYIGIKIITVLMFTVMMFVSRLKRYNSPQEFDDGESDEVEMKMLKNGTVKA